MQVFLLKIVFINKFIRSAAGRVSIDIQRLSVLYGWVTGTIKCGCVFVGTRSASCASSNCCIGEFAFISA